MQATIDFALRSCARLRGSLAGLAGALMLFMLGSGAPVGAQSSLPVLWTASNSGAGNGTRIASDAAGNVVVVSGNFNLVTTSYTAAGAFRWSNTVPNNPGWLSASWVAAAPNGDFVVVGTRVSTQTGLPYEAIVIRYSNAGTQLWRQDIQTGGGRYACQVGRLLVDASGNAYLVGSFVGTNVDATILKYGPTGTLLWSSKDLLVANSVAVGPDGADVIVTGFVPGNFSVRTASHDAATGALKWFVNSPEAGGGRDLVLGDTRVYVTGQGVTDPGTPAIAYHLTVIAYDRATGARLWRTDSRPPAPSQAAGYWIALAPDGSLVAAGSASASSYLNWWIVAMDRDGNVRWQATRDRATTGDESPNGLFVLGDGTTVVSGVGGPTVSSPTGSVYLQGVTAGYGPTGAALWEGFAPVSISWAIPLPTGAVVATGGSDALTTAWSLPGPPAAPSNLTARYSSGAIVLGWQDNSNNETTFTVERCIQGLDCPAFSVLATLPADMTGFADSAFVAGRTSSYRIRASNASGASDYSNVASEVVFSSGFPPTAVAQAVPGSGTAPLTVTFDGSRSRDLDGSIVSWIWAFGDGTSGTGVATSHVYSVPGTYVAALTVMDNSHLIATATTGSIVVTASVQPAAPTNLTATALTRSSIGLAWMNGAIGQAEVRVERCKGSSCTNFVEVAAMPGTATIFTDTVLASGTTYRYRVRARNAAGFSPYSNIASARTRK